jgi:hypothetical protein
MFMDDEKRIVPFGVKLSAALGLIDGIQTITKFGVNPSVGNVSFDTIWDGAGVYQWPESAQILSFVSDNAEDYPAGDGASVVRIEGLDSNYSPINEDVTMNGLSPVNTIKEYLRINNMCILPTFLNNTPVPNVQDAMGTITASYSGNTYAQIVNGNNCTLSSIFTVPAGFTALLFYGAAGTGKAKEAHVQYLTRLYSGVFQIAYDIFTFQSDIERPFEVPQCVAEKTDLQVKAKADIAGIQVYASYDLVLINNDLAGIGG